MDQQVNLYSKFIYKNVMKVKIFEFKWLKLYKLNPKLNDLIMNKWKTELISVAKD